MQSICTCAYKSHITIIICTNEFEEYMIYRCISTYINACQEFMTVTAGYQGLHQGIYPEWYVTCEMQEFAGY